MSAMILRRSNPGTLFKHYIDSDSVEMAAVQEKQAGKHPFEQSQES